MKFLDHDDLTRMGIKPTSKAQRWRLIKAGKFPAPVKQGQSNTWTEDQIAEYVLKLLAGGNKLDRASLAAGERGE